MRKSDCLLAGLALCFALTSSTLTASAADDHVLQDRQPVAGSRHPLARAENDLGPPAPDTWIDGLTLVLRPRAEAAEDLERLLIDQQRPGSPAYHRWITPDEYGRRFGLSDADLFALIGWLEQQGLRVSEPPRGRGWLNFSGTVGELERAFSTRIRRYAAEETEHLANETEISMPRRFSSVVAAGSTLASFPPRTLHRKIPISSKRPQFTSPSGSHALSPADFAAIYNVAPLHARGLTGKGVSIAVLGTSNVNLDDVRRFRSFFGLPVNDPRVVLNGADPAKGAAEAEADLDLEWSGAVAPDAEVLLVLTGGGGEALFLSGQYAVNQNLASIITVSFGSCESAAVRGWDALWTQAATQGISVFVSTGDSGCSCDPFTSASATGGRRINGIASSPYATAVGGTQFAGDVADPSAYWASGNTLVTGASALSYIPETAWNESGGVVPDAPLFAGGGGFSTLFQKQSWQDAPGVPADPRRPIPDVALTAAAHDPYLFYSESDPTLFGGAGTSASTPAFAGIAALVSQGVGGRLGNMNPRLYELGRAQYANGGFPVFHDIAEGNNSVPGATGFDCGNGYDLVTGLGSVDAAALVSAWSPAAPSTCAPGSTALCLNGGRFRVTASWRNVSTGDSGAARAVPLSGDTGYFWFFTDNNIELVVKALDGRPVNGKFWFFYGALSNVEYSITVTDTTTGLSRSYFNPQGRQASVADVSAF
jgi:subtilase family serine protease